MNNINIERALTCRLIDSYMKQHGLVGPLTTEHLAKVSWHIVELLTSTQVRELYEENGFHSIDVERTDLYEVYMPRLVERFAASRFDKHTADNEPVTEEHLRDLIGDFQDIVWNGYSDDAIQVD